MVIEEETKTEICATAPGVDWSSMHLDPTGQLPNGLEAKKCNHITPGSEVYGAVDTWSRADNGLEVQRLHNLFSFVPGKTLVADVTPLLLVR